MAKQLQDFSKKENKLNLGSLTIGFAAEHTMKELKRQDNILIGELKNLMKECRMLVITLLEKLFARGITGLSFLKSVGCIDQLSISTTPQENLITDMKQVLHHLLFLNVERAFDKFWFNGLRLKLQKLKIPEMLIRWISSFIRNRSMSIQIKDLFYFIKSTHCLPQFVNG